MLFCVKLFLIILYFFKYRNRFIDHMVARDITKNLLSRMPSPASRWCEYWPDMKDELFKGFLEVKLKRRISFLEVYDDVHEKKSGEYVLKYPRKSLTYMERQYHKNMEKI
ncbi:hypothetical protein S83_035188 [Arachis hypogaea]